MSNKVWIPVLIAVSVLCSAAAQIGVGRDLPAPTGSGVEAPVVDARPVNIPFSDPRWQLEGERAEIVKLDGREALLLNNGRAVLLDADFDNGIIEFDVMVNPERGFHGLRFRIHDEINSEYFYIRPLQSGKEDANQYTPVFNGLSGWQLYFGPAFSAPTVYRFGEWMRIRVVVAGEKADIYIGGEEPALHVARLKNRRVAGPLMLMSGLAPAYFSRFRMEKQDAPAITGTGAAIPAPPAGILPTWSVSSPFDEQRLAGATELDEEFLAELDWQSLRIEDRGYANLARVARRAEGADTVFARARIPVDTDSIRRIRFGYSDRVRVYLNGVMLYAGDNGYSSRDFRYLGTIGLFDELPLHLRAGDNDLVFAVSESFGGWGVMAQLLDPE